MTIAEICGKLSPHEVSEDLLTSDVFGACRYLPTAYGIVPFLGAAVDFSPDHELPKFLRDVVAAEYFFWPKTSEYRREPDLLIVLTTGDQRKIGVVVECKYHAPKSNSTVEDATDEEAGSDRVFGDQLAVQYEELWFNRLVLEKRVLDDLRGSNTEKYLVYVTAHYDFPAVDADETLRELRRWAPGGHAKKLFWLSWRSAHPALAASRNRMREELSGPYCQGLLSVVDDTLALLERKNLVPFGGFARLEIPIKTVHLQAPLFWQPEFWMFSTSIR